MPGPFYFAWAGGTIQSQVTVVTNGTTHGAIPKIIALVGDTVTGERQLTNIASTQQLEVGSYYDLTGPGIPDAQFLFDDTILSGLPDSVNLNAAASSSNKSATYTAKQSVPLATGLATYTAGSGTVTLTDVAGIPAGNYAAFGTGIGETNVPLGTTSDTTYTTGGGVMLVSYCSLVYDGSGGGSLVIVAATPYTTTSIDEFGQTINVTTYTVAQQTVRATVSGTYPIQLSGFPSGDPAVITNIPAGGLSGLVSGLRYNISGPGIPLGATFVAPSGGTSITLDLDTTASETNAILTITGPRTPDAPFDAAVHNRFDEDIVNLEISQEEGGFATATVDIKNPNIGLLALGRNLWAWISWDQNWTPGGTAAPSLVPLFNGRLIGVPKLAAGEIMQIQFLGRPDDLNAQKLALSESLKVRPYYDPVWLASNVTPDTVLETYSALYHVDRVNLSLSVSDILQGEAGTVTIDEGTALYDHFALSYGQPPLLATTVSGTVTWQQQGEGTIDVTQNLLDAFHAAGSAYKYTYRVKGWNTGGGGLIEVLGDGIKSDWPRAGLTIGGGWSLSTRNDGDGYPLCYIQDATISSQGGWIAKTTFNLTYSAFGAATSQAGKTTDESNVDIFLRPLNQYNISFPLNVYKIRMNLQYNADRKRTETVTAIVTAGVQRELSDSSESDRETISLSSDYVAQGVDPDGALPIGDVGYKSYFQTDRGNDSLKYLLLLARAKMRARARAADVTLAVDWRSALPITLRNSIYYVDRRLPGGSCTGKVKSYRLMAGVNGMLGEFTIGCTIGTDEAIAAIGGTNYSYVAAGYVASGYQIIYGDQTLLSSGDLAYQTLDDFAVVDDGLDLANVTVDDAVNACYVTNGLSVQVPKLAAFNNTTVTSGSPRKTFATSTTTATIDLKPVQGSEFHTEFFPAISQLRLPKTIDLAAPSGG